MQFGPPILHPATVVRSVCIVCMVGNFLIELVAHFERCGRFPFWGTGFARRTAKNTGSLYAVKKFIVIGRIVAHDRLPYLICYICFTSVLGCDWNILMFLLCFILHLAHLHTQYTPDDIRIYVSTNIKARF